jgi:hypothetical protein
LVALQRHREAIRVERRRKAFLDTLGRTMSLMAFVRPQDAPDAEASRLNDYSCLPSLSLFFVLSTKHGCDHEGVSHP